MEVLQIRLWMWKYDHMREIFNRIDEKNRSRAYLHIQLDTLVLHMVCFVPQALQHSIYFCFFLEFFEKFL
jgi:hypothetical protein